MPFNASGFFQRLFNWRNDRDAGIKILAERMDQEMDGIVVGINDIVSANVDWKGPMTGVFGTAAAPAYSFQEDPNTGVYRVSADVLGFSVGGTLKVRVSASDVTFDGHTMWHAGNPEQAPFVRSDVADTAEQKITMRKEAFVDRTDNSSVVGSLRTNNSQAILHLVANADYDNRVEIVARSNGDYGALWADSDRLKWYRDGLVEVGGELSAGSIKWGSQSLDDRYLGRTAKAADAELLDGINSTQFLRTDTSGTVSQLHTHRDRINVTRTNNDPLVGRFQTNSDQAFIQLVPDANINNRIEVVARSGGEYAALWAGSDYLRVYRDGQVRLTDQPNLCAKGAYVLSTSNNLAIRFPSIIQNAQNRIAMTNSNSRFTVPCGGVYLIAANVSCLLSSSNDFGDMFIYKNGSALSEKVVIRSDGLYWQNGALCICEYLNANDYIEVRRTVATDVVTSYGNFTICMIA